jgi:hypothetical protein
MKPLFWKLPEEQRSKLLDTIYASTLAINLFLFQSLIGTTPDFFISGTLINIAVGIPASAGAILAKRIQQRSTPIDKRMGYLAFLNTTVAIGASLWRFSPEIGVTFLVCALCATLLVFYAHHFYAPEPPPQSEQPLSLTGQRTQTHYQQGVKKRK